MTSNTAKQENHFLSQTDIERVNLTFTDILFSTKAVLELNARQTAHSSAVIIELL